MATRAPSRAKVAAIYLPIPLAAPVTTATLSFRRIQTSFEAAARSLFVLLFATVTVEIEGEDALVIDRALKHFWMLQVQNRAQ